MALLMNQLHGLGQAEIIAAIVGPVVTGGADAYRTYAERDLSKDELKQRQKEFAALSKFQQEQLETQERAQIMARHGALQQQALRTSWWNQNMPLIVGGVVLLGLALAVATRKRG